MFVSRSPSELGGVLTLSKNKSWLTLMYLTSNYEKKSSLFSFSEVQRSSCNTPFPYLSKPGYQIWRQYSCNSPSGILLLLETIYSLCSSTWLYTEMDLLVSPEQLHRICGAVSSAPSCALPVCPVAAELWALAPSLLSEHRTHPCFSEHPTHKHDLPPWALGAGCEAGMCWNTCWSNESSCPTDPDGFG